MLFSGLDHSGSHPFNYSGTSLQRASKERPDSLQRPSRMERNVFHILTMY